jgi:hypothetical protein
LSRIEFSLDALPDSFARFYEKGRDLKLVREIPGLTLEGLVDESLLRAAIERQKLSPKLASDGATTATE